MNRSHLQIVVLIDALGWEYIKDRQFLSDLLPYRTRLATVLGFSSGAIPTILTGMPPAVTGHWNLFYYDPKGSPFHWLRHFQVLPDRLLDSRISRKLIKELGRHVLGMGPLFECCVSPRLLPWFNWVEKGNIYDAGGVTGARSIFDDFRQQGTGYRVYSYHHQTDEQILDQAKRDVAESQATFFFVYLCEMDMYLHMNCHSPDKVDERLLWYEHRLRDLFTAARERDGKMTFSVCSDHGMTPVREHYDLVRDVDALGLRMPEDYLAVYDSTMARFWFFNERARERVTGALNRLRCGRVISDQELQALGVFFPDQRFGELVFLLNPGCLLAKSDFNGRGWMPTGMHGYHPEDSYSDAIFLTNRKPEFAMCTIADVHRFIKTHSTNFSADES
jgi:type I phosphodiesterase/nucleotide pyrophosphatase